MPTFDEKTGLLKFSEEELQQMRHESLLGMGWKLHHRYRARSSDMPGVYYTGAVGDPIDEALAQREQARVRMAERAAELDRQRIAGRWAQILNHIANGVREISRQTGVSAYLNERGEAVDQFGQPLKK